MADWSEANCKDADPEIFFPIGTITRENRIEIRRMCGTCVVQAECLAFGKATHSIGIWGGQYL